MKRTEHRTRVALIIIARRLYDGPIGKVSAAGLAEIADAALYNKPHAHLDRFCEDSDETK